VWVAFNQTSEEAAQFYLGGDGRGAGFSYVVRGGLSMVRLTVIALVVVALCSQASAATSRKSSPGLHLWQLIAQNGDGITYIDQQSKVRSADGTVTFWTLQTVADKINGGVNRSKYSVTNFTVDCNRRTIRGNSSTAYMNGEGTSSANRGSFQLINPESVGEFMLLAACKGQLQYQFMTPVTSIDSAITQSDQILRLIAEQQRMSTAELLDDIDLRSIAGSFNEAMSTGGMIGVSELVTECYAETTKEATLSNAKAIARCITLDLMGLDMDTSFRREMGRQTGKEIPAVSFYEEAAWTGRLKNAVPQLIVIDPTMTTGKLRSYTDSANKQLVAIMDAKNAK